MRFWQPSEQNRREVFFPQPGRHAREHIDVGGGQVVAAQPLVALGVGVLTS